MSVVSLLGVQVMNNPAKFTDKYEFEITFECLEHLEKGGSITATSQVAFAMPCCVGTDPACRSRVEAHLRRLCHQVRCRQPSRTPPWAGSTLTGSSDQYDQELDSLLVGPIPVGVNKFVFEADAPNTSRIPDNDILGVTVVLLTCAYDGREFVRVGYYVNNEYDSEELNAEPPSKLLIDRVRRNILSEKPRVTRFAIKWYVHKIPQTPILCVASYSG